jgi:hypothetical protein
MENTYLEKIMDYHNGALFVIAAPASWGVTRLFKIMFEGVDQKDLIMPLVVVGVGLFSFFILYFVDFILGIKASQKQNNKISNDKLWQSFWKFFGVVVLLFCMTIFSFLFIALDLGTIYTSFLYLMIAIMIMVCLYEFQSIGKNMEVLYNKKPKYFAFFEKMANAVESGIIKKIQKLFN